MIYCIGLRKLTPTLITLNFSCAFILGLYLRRRGSLIKLLPIYVSPAIIPDSGQLTVFTVYILSAKPSQISAKAY